MFWVKAKSVFSEKKEETTPSTGGATTTGRQGADKEVSHKSPNHISPAAL